MGSSDREQAFTKSDLLHRTWGRRDVILGGVGFLEVFLLVLSGPRAHPMSQSIEYDYRKYPNSRQASICHKPTI